MNRKTRMAIIGTVGLPARYGGFETLTEHLVEELGSTYELHVYCSGKTYKPEERVDQYKSAKLHYVPLEANGLQSIFYDALSLIHALFVADVFLVLGVSGAWLFPFLRMFTRKRIIVSIDGIEWKRDKWSLPARIYLWWAERIAVKYSHIDISDNESIQNYTAFRYGSLSRVIEYGGDHTLHVSVKQSDSKKYPFILEPYAFKVCRIEPENNVHVVLEAFSQMPGHALVLVGNWDKSEYGRDLKRHYSAASDLHLLDPIYDQKELDLLRGNAHFYIHGHSAGGTNPSLVEAMHLGLPVLSYGVSYNYTTTEGKARYFTDAESLIHIIRSMSNSERSQLGTYMQEIAFRRYTWKHVAHKYDLLAKEALELREKSKVKPNYSKLNSAVLRDMQVGHLAHPSFFYDLKN